MDTSPLSRQSSRKFPYYYTEYQPAQPGTSHGARGLGAMETEAPSTRQRDFNKRIMGHFADPGPVAARVSKREQLFSEYSAWTQWIQHASLPIGPFHI